VDQYDGNSRQSADHSNAALRELTLERLRSARERLCSASIMHAAVFGSVARGEAAEDSDIDILVDLDPAAHIDLFEFVGLILLRKSSHSI
jgi:predicted nucleotidyltransferase